MVGVRSYASEGREMKGKEWKGASVPSEVGAAFHLTVDARIRVLLSGSGASL
jgi:hypothetical protein